MMINRFLLIAVCLSVWIPAVRADVALNRKNNIQWEINGNSYRCQLLPLTMTASFDLKAGEYYVPLTFRAPRLIVWKKTWVRIFDGNSVGGKNLEVKTLTNGVNISFQEQSQDIECRSRYLFQDNRVTLAATITFLREVKGFCRATYELNPAWDLVHGGQLDFLRADGTVGRLILPDQPTAEAAYHTVLNGKFTQLKTGNFSLLPDASFTISGNFDASLEQTGNLFRWHLGSIAANDDTTIPAGTTMNLQLHLDFTPAGAIPLKDTVTTVTVDTEHPGYTVHPELFGVHLGDIGHGIKTQSMRHPWQNNFLYDQESLKYATEGGVTFFRVYLHTLYDVLGWNGADAASDPISPYDGAPCDYSRIDSFVAGLRLAKIDLMPCVGLYCPPWLSTKRPSDKHRGLWMTHRSPPKDNAKWAAIIAGLVRYCNQDKKWNIRLWMPANEPNDPSRYWVGGTLSEFSDYYQTAYRAMKQADPEVMVTGPDLSDIFAVTKTEPKLVWRDEFVRRNRGQFDVFSFNCYNHDDFTLFVKAARETLAANGAAGCPIYIAEYNITAGEYDQPGVFNFTGAAFLARSLKSLMENGVERASFFSWDQLSLGFFDRSPDDHLIPRPTYYVFKMHAALGYLKNGKVLKNICSDRELSVLSVKHPDCKGYTVIMCSASSIKNFSVALNLGKAEGEYVMKQYQLVPDKILTEQPEEKHSLEKTMTFTLPGNAVTMLVFRSK